MQFDLSEFAVHCIGPTEPAFVAAFVIAVLAALLATAPLRRLGGRVTTPSRRRVYLPLLWGCAALMLFVGTVALTHFLYYLSHPRVMLCTAFVWPAFLVAPVTLLVRGMRRPSNPGSPVSVAEEGERGPQ